MKKIGILFGKERSFPQAFIDRVNSKNIEGVSAEFVRIDKVMQGEPTEYAVIIDRISQDVPFYRAYLKNAALRGTAVINNPFWWSADEKFFNNALATQIDVPVPKTVLLPSKDHPDDTSAESFLNLAFPLDWEGMFDYIGFPAYMKPFAGGGWKNVYRLENKQDFFQKFEETHQLVMMLQEEIKFESYFRCYCIGRKYVKIMPYEPRNPHHLRYVASFDVSDELMKTMEEYVLRLNEFLGYDFNTVELAVRDGIPYAIDFCNPAPDADRNSVGEDNFEWVVENVANYAIERAQAHQEGQDNLSWGKYLQQSIGAHTPVATPKPAKATKKAAPKKAAKPKAKATPEKPAENDANATLLSKVGTVDADQKDDLTKIKGVGPKLATLLNNMGIFTFEQISKMTQTEYDLVDSLLTSFKGRGKRDDWAGQAKTLLA